MVNLLNRAQLDPAMTYNQDFTTPPTLWSARPRHGEIRTCYDFSEGAPYGRGLDLNNSGVVGGGQSAICSDATYLGGMVGNPFVFDGATCQINCTPITAAGKAAVAASVGSTYGFSKTPTHVTGLLNLSNKLTQQYGYFEVRAKENPFTGSWSGVYLMNPTGSPHCEIDIMERLGGPESGYIYQTATTRYDKYGALRPASAPELSSQTKLAVTAGDFHNFGMLWRPDLLVWYVDDAETKRVTNDGWDQPLNLIVDFTANGNWPRNRGWIADPSAAGGMTIDHIRAWQLL